MGKTFYIKQTTRKLKQRFRKASSQCTIAIHGPEATPDTVMDFLSKHLQDPSCSMYHIDIASDVSFTTLCVCVREVNSLSVNAVTVQVIISAI